MTARRSGAGIILEAARASEDDWRRIWARGACAALLASEAAPADGETDVASLDRSFEFLANLAGSPSPDMAGIAAKLASLVHLQLKDDVRHFYTATQVEFALTASALADAVLIGDRPIGRPNPPNRDSAGAA